MKRSQAAGVLLLVVGTVLVPACGGGSGGGSAGVAGPVVAGVNPAQACIGDEVELAGSGFGTVQGSNTVTLTGITASIVSWSDTLIRATVPSGATSGPVRVWVTGNPSNPGSLVVLWSPILQNIPVCGVSGEQFNPQLISDASGGAIMVWADHRNDLGDINAQRVDGAGALQWGPMSSPSAPR